MKYPANKEFSQIREAYMRGFSRGFYGYLDLLSPSSPNEPVISIQPQDYAQAHDSIRIIRRTGIAKN